VKVLRRALLPRDEPHRDDRRSHDAVLILRRRLGFGYRRLQAPPYCARP